MLKSLHLSGVGPAPEMQVDFAPRINVLTGDNGLGKSFLLEVAWWALAGRWLGRPAWPRPGAEPFIEVVWDQGSVSRFTFDFASWSWHQSPQSAGDVSKTLTVFARVDGGFAVCDPYRLSAPDGMLEMLRGGSAETRETEVFAFDSRQIWEGLRIGSRSVCEGFERDWVRWQESNKPEFSHLLKVLEILSAPEEKLVPAKPMRVDPSESFDRPALETVTGVIPVVFASAGVRRILALTYLLVWTVTEHRLAAQLTRREPTKKMVLLFDEPENHLHPKWQRTIVPSVVSAVSELTGIEVQLITATHSPLVLASLEPTFDPEKDQLIDLHLDGNELVVDKVQWRRRGDATAWLTSEIFDLKSARSIEAEEALEQAAEVLGEEPPNPARARELDQRLRGLLGESDPFWIRWRYLGEKQGWLE